MTNKIFKIFAAFLTLILYLSTILASDMAALTCSCSEFLAHMEHHSHCSNHEECSCCHCDCNLSDVLLQNDGCCCEHDHSNNVELYTMPRIGDDDGSTRYVLALFDAVDHYDSDARCDLEAKSCSYGDYLLPPLQAAYSGSFSLRAPPALV